MLFICVRIPDSDETFIWFTSFVVTLHFCVLDQFNRAYHETVERFVTMEYHVVWLLVAKW